VSNLRYCWLSFDYFEVDLSGNSVSGWFAALPRSIECLELAGLETSFKPNHPSLLPPQLRSFVMESSLVSDDWSWKMPFPPHLTRLDVPLLLSPYLGPLPQSLTELSHPTSEESERETAYTPESFALLPRTLLHLYVNANLPRRQEHRFPVSLPNGLLTLSTPTRDYTNEAINSIPSSVTTLNAWSLTYEPDYKLSSSLHLGKLLELLLHADELPATTYRAVAVGCPNLVRFHVGFPKFAFPEGQGEPLRQKQVPSKVNRIEFLQSWKSDQLGAQQGPLHFGAKMEAFSSPFGYYGDELVSTLPVSLTFLTLSASPCITDSSIYLYVQYFHALSTFICFSPAISGSSFPLLPRQLTRLSLPASTIIVDEEMIHLPPALETLHLNSAHALTDACGPTLPKKLRILSLDDNELVSPRLAQHLDPNIAVVLFAKPFSAKWINKDLTVKWKVKVRRFKAGVQN
jgi:hypothetical protein